MAPELIECQTYNGNRHYKLKDNGVEYFLPSVTTILKELDKPALMGWAVKSTIKYIAEGLYDIADGDNVDLKKAKDIFKGAVTGYKGASKEATDVGTEVHLAIENWLKKGEQPLSFNSKAAENGFKAYLDWEKKNNFKFLESEILVYDADIQCAGTLDCIGTINGKRFLIDFKTSKGIYSEYYLQTAIYTYCYNKLNPDNKIKGIGILRLDKITGLPEWKDCTSHAVDYLEMFKGLATFFKLKQKLKNINEF